MKYIITAIVLILLFTGLMWLVLDKQFVTDCRTWQHYEKEYPLFELNTSMIDECAKEGIIIK